MNFPIGFNPLAVTEIIINACYFPDSDPDAATEKLQELFPNAEIGHALLHEDRSICICEIHPEELLTNEQRRELYIVLEDALPQGPYRGRPDLFDCNFSGGENTAGG